MDASCGLVMNKDEIQPTGLHHGATRGCGLVMNKDEIQLGLRGCTDLFVVVW